MGQGDNNQIVIIGFDFMLNHCIATVECRKRGNHAETLITLKNGGYFISPPAL